jgi:hypothetical protein
VPEGRDSTQINLYQGIGPVLDPFCDHGVSRPTVRWVVLDAAVLRRIVRGGDDDAVGQSRAPAPVVGENGVGDDRGRRVAAILVHHDQDAMGRHTSKTLAKAGSDRACVSLPRYSGPVMFFILRYS